MPPVLLCLLSTDWIHSVARCKEHLNQLITATDAISDMLLSPVAWVTRAKTGKTKRRLKSRGNITSTLLYSDSSYKLQAFSFDRGFSCNKLIKNSMLTELKTVKWVHGLCIYKPAHVLQACLWFMITIKSLY